MARMKLIPRRTLADVITPQQWARRLRTYYRHSNTTFGEFLAGFVALWEEAKNYVTDYEASQCLINQVPCCWRVWAISQMEELMFKDSITAALCCRITDLVQRLLDRWTTYGNPPNIGQLEPEMCRSEMLAHVCSNGENVCSLRCQNSDNQVEPSTKSVLRQDASSDDVVEVRRTRELARKRTHDSAGGAVDVCRLGKRSRRVLIIQEKDGADDH